MLDIAYVINNIEEVRTNLANRNVKVDVDQLLELYKQKIALQQITDDYRQQINTLSDKIKRAPDAEKKEIVQESKAVKEKLKEQEILADASQAAFTELLKKLPNRTHPAAPVGTDEHANVEVYRYKEPTSFSFVPKDHIELGKQLDLIDFESATKVSGAKFYFLKNDAVRLELALINFAIDTLQQEDFTLIATPDLAKTEILEGIGFNPRGEETQVYSIENSDLCLIGTAEITLGGMLSNTTINEADLPIKLLGLSHCFRTEAGAYGKFSKGLYRVHQFTKLEMFVFTTPDQSDQLHEYLRKLEEKLFESLGLPFRTVDICTGDLGGPAYRKYDLEAWMPGRQADDGTGTGNWGEVTSTSNCTDYQSRRLGIKYKGKQGKPAFVHMLNGTAFAMTRVILAILENFQQEDGTIRIPEVLQKYMGADVIRPKAKKTPVN